MKFLIADNWSQGRHLCLGPPEYREALHFTSRRSLWKLHKKCNKPSI